MQSNVAIAETPELSSNNIIRGPWASREAPISILEVSPLVGVKVVKATHITETLIAVAPQLFNNIELAGFTVEDGDDSDTFLEGTLIVEAIKSLLCKHYGLYHPLQDIAEALFVKDEEAGLKFADRIDIDLDPMESIEVELPVEPEPDFDL